MFGIKTEEMAAVLLTDQNWYLVLENSFKLNNDIAIFRSRFGDGLTADIHVKKDAIVAVRNKGKQGLVQ
jgi:hypothetical protein